jgi:hypothetical protein
MDDGKKDFRAGDGSVQATPIEVYFTLFPFQEQFLKVFRALPCLTVCPLIPAKSRASCGSGFTESGSGSSILNDKNLKTKRQLKVFKIFF